MKLGVHSFLWTKYFNESHLHLLPILKQHGFDGIEIARYQFDDFPAKAIGNALRDEGLECTLCCGLTGEWNLISEDKAVREKTLTFLRKLIDIALDLGSNHIVGPLCAPLGYFTGKRRTSQEWQWASEGLQTWGQFLSEANLTFALEPLNRYQSYFLNTTEDGVKLFESIDYANMGLLYDVFHANIEEKNLSKTIETAGTSLKHFHVCGNDRGIPGDDHLPWNDIFSSLKMMNYTGWIVIESFNFFDEEIYPAARIWRDLAETPEQIAFEGAKFLHPYLR